MSAFWFLLLVLLDTFCFSGALLSMKSAWKEEKVFALFYSIVWLSVCVLGILSSLALFVSEVAL